VLVVDKSDNRLAPSTADARAADVAMGSGPHIVAVAASDRAAAVIPPDFELQYETADTLVFKNAAMHELDKVRGGVRWRCTAGCHATHSLQPARVADAG